MECTGADSNHQGILLRTVCLRHASRLKSLPVPFACLPRACRAIASALCLLAKGTSLFLALGTAMPSGDRAPAPCSAAPNLCLSLLSSQSLRRSSQPVAARYNFQDNAFSKQKGTKMRTSALCTRCCDVAGRHGIAVSSLRSGFKASLCFIYVC